MYVNGVHPSGCPLNQTQEGPSCGEKTAFGSAKCQELLLQLVWDYMFVEMFCQIFMMIWKCKWAVIKTLVTRDISLYWLVNSDPYNGSSILIGFFIINHPFGGTHPYFWKHPFEDINIQTGSNRSSLAIYKSKCACAKENIPFPWRIHVWFIYPHENLKNQPFM